MDSLHDVIVQHCQLQAWSCPRRRPCTGGECQRKPATDDAINEFGQADESPLAKAIRKARGGPAPTPKRGYA
jgi:hypothetical protein